MLPLPSTGAVDTLGAEVGWKGTGGVGVGGEGWYRVVCRVLLMRVHGEFGEPGACAVFGKREKDKSGDMCVLARPEITSGIAS